MRRFSIFIFLLLCGATVSLGQTGPGREKVYVHLDRTYFAIGETMWLKGYVENALSAPDSSRFLYIELVGGKDEEAVLRGKIRLGAEGFAGHLDLPEDMSGGRYMLRAYTRFQMNWPEEWMFHCPVEIYDGKDSPEAVPGADYDVSFYPEGGRYFYGNLLQSASRSSRRTVAVRPLRASCLTTSATSSATPGQSTPEWGC